MDQGKKGMFGRLGLALVLAVYLMQGMAQAQTLVNQSGKKWNIKLGTSFAYDDNVVNQPNRPSARPAGLPADPGDTSFSLNGQSTLKLTFNNKFFVRAIYDIDMTVYSDLNQYDLTSQVFGISPTYKITPTMHFMMDYNFIYNIVDGANFSGINYIGPSINHMHAKIGLTRLYYTFKNTHNWQNKLRHNQHHTVGASHFLFFSNYTRRIGIDYQYSSEDTLGSAFDRDNHRVKVKGQTPLLWGWKGEVDIAYTFREYDSRLGSPTALRDDTLQRYQIGFSRVLLEQWSYLQDLTLTLKYRRLENNTNLLPRDFSSNRGDIVLVARF